MSQDTVLVWMLSLNREYIKAEYDTAYQLVNLCFPDDKYEYKPHNPDSFRQLVTQLLPVLMMRHRRVPRAKWKDYVTPTGKHWIDHVNPNPVPEGQPRPRMPSIGYHLTYHNSLCGMAVTQGIRNQVVNIGLGVRQRKVEPKGTPIGTFLESQAHKLTPLEIASIANNPEDVMLKRLCILLSLKESYIRAIGQPFGFDYSRLEFDVVNRTMAADGAIQTGWEFRVFGARLGVARGTQIKQEEYECACSYFRGNKETKFIFHETPQQLEHWVQFINIDQLMAVSAKLAA